MKKWLIVAFLAAIFSFIALLFWYSDWQYSLPTPVPVNYVPVPVNGHIDLGNLTPVAGGRPLFLHFFNPGCPCSKFNMPHFKSLVKNYGDRVNFIVVVLSDETAPVAADIKEQFGLSIPVVMNKGYAATCGVYSTPQAVLLDKNQQLYYRGNYNRTRYCTSKETNYAEQALNSLVSQQSTPAFTSAALTPYGCSLPTCTNPIQ